MSGEGVHLRALPHRRAPLAVRRGRRAHRRPVRALPDLLPPRVLLALRRAAETEAAAAGVRELDRTRC